jgi:sugar phosphate isomerase/epimerase
MRIGVDGRKIPEAAKRGPIASFDHAREMGMSGLFFRSVIDMSPTLDLGLLRDVRAKADSLGMYMESGLGKVNPYALAEAPEIRVLGDGDTVRGYRRMLEACAHMECRELWCATANYKPAFIGKYAYDRFRTDVSWTEQLEATARFMKKLAPIARDLGIHMNIETHEEVTSFELVRIVETVGPDVSGIVYDTGNVLQRTEHPVFAAKRIAHYTRQTHMKDAVVVRGAQGIDFQKRPFGEGAVDFRGLLPILAAAKPDLHLSIENDESYTDRPRPYVWMRIDIDDPEWRTAHPDLTDEELAAFMELVTTCEARVREGKIEDVATFAKRRPGYRETVDFIKHCGAHLRSICIEQNLPLQA